MAHFSIKREQLELVLIKESLFLTFWSFSLDIIWLFWKHGLVVIAKLHHAVLIFLAPALPKKKRLLLLRIFPSWHLIFFCIILELSDSCEEANYTFLTYMCIQFGVKTLLPFLCYCFSISFSPGLYEGLSLFPRVRLNSI